MPDLFRKKSLEHAQSPEDLREYIRITTPPVWLALLASVVLLLGVLAWSILGTVSITDDLGNEKEIHPITFVTN